MNIESLRQANRYMREIHNWEECTVNLKVRIATSQEEKMELVNILTGVIDDYVGNKIKELNKKIEQL